jgi:NAD(P)-dependent dehydrogenase (short-subunit alcohol dehydrogenase family)
LIAQDDYAAKSDDEKAVLKEQFLLNNPNLRIAGLDVTDQEQVDRAVTAVIEEDGRIDVLVNNAGYGVPGVLELVPLEDAQHMFDVNVWGAAR